MIFTVALIIIWAGAVLTLASGVLFILAGLVEAINDRDWRHAAFVAAIGALFGAALAVVVSVGLELL